jgi:hypothetical protein
MDRLTNPAHSNFNTIHAMTTVACILVYLHVGTARDHRAGKAQLIDHWIPRFLDFFVLCFLILEHSLSVKTLFEKMSMLP